MKILYLCTDFGIPVLGGKGAAVHVRELIAAFGRAGHSVLLTAQSLNGAWEEPQQLDGMLLPLPSASEAVATVQTLKIFNELLAVENVLPGHVRRIAYNQEVLRLLKRRFRKHPPDFIYERASLFSIAGVLLAQELDRPLIIELNAPLSKEQSTYRGQGLGDLAAQAELWALSRADAVLTVSDQLSADVVSRGVNPDNVYVIPNGVNAALFHPKAPDAKVRAAWGLRKGPTLGFVGGLRPWHGVKVLPALLDTLARTYQDVQMVIVGEGPLRGALEDDFKERKLTKNVVFTGSVQHEKVAGLIRQFDIALAPYPRLDHDFYFSPLKLFEYMGCGVPVVAADIGQIAKVVRSGETGVLYPSGDLEGLISACKGLLAHPDVRRQMGQAASEEIHKKYTWDHNTTRIAEIAHSLIAKKEEKSG